MPNVAGKGKSSWDFNIYLFIYFDRAGSLLLCGLFLQLRRVRASHRSGFSCCRAWALGCTGFSSSILWAQQLGFAGSRAQAHYLCHTGTVALQHVESSWIRDWPSVFGIDRWSKNSLPLSGLDSLPIPGKPLGFWVLDPPNLEVRQRKWNWT